MIESDIYLLDLSPEVDTSSVLDALKKNVLSLAVVSQPDNLLPFIGQCALVELPGIGEIKAAEISACVADLQRQTEKFSKLYSVEISFPQRVLFKTQQNGQKDSARLFSVEAIDKLAEHFILIGTDNKVIDQEPESVLLEYLLKKPLPCLFNLDLQAVEPGIMYDLYAAPQAVSKARVCPVRPILIPR